METNFGSIILGAVLAFGGGLIAFFIQHFWAQKQQQKIVVNFLHEMLRAFHRVAPKVIDNFDRTGVAWFDLLQQLSDDLGVYERNKEHLVRIKDPTLRSELWDWFSSARTCVNLALGSLRNQIHDPENQTAKELVSKEIRKLKDLDSESQRLQAKLK